MELFKIIKREAVHTSNVYLYEENGTWYAYGHSAQLICKLLEEIVNLKHIICDTFCTLMKVEIDLQWLMKCDITSCSDNELIIAYPQS